jgi:cytoskeleton protein RodZ
LNSALQALNCEQMGPPPKTTPQEFGEALRSTRSAAGIALDTIAERTKISLQTLSALEAGNFGRMPNRVFARMFLRQYLELLGRSPDDWMSAFEAAWQRYDEFRQLVPAHPEVPVRRRRVGPWLVGLGLVAAGVVGVLLVEQRPRDAQTVLASPTPQTTATFPMTAPTPAPPGPVETPAPRPDMLVVRTGQAPCWVEVRIASEKPVARLLQAGTTWEVPAGGREVELMLGDAGAASVEYMGEVRSPAGAPGAVARFRLTGSPAPKPER